MTRSKIKVLPLTSQVIKMVEQWARDEGVSELRTYSRRDGQVILDGDLLAGVDPDDLWDEEYDPDEDTPPESDDNLRWEKISGEEIEDLIEDAANDLQALRESDEEYEKLVKRKGFEIVEWRDRTSEWSEFVWDRWHQFREGLNTNNDDPRSSEYLSKIDTFYGTIARALHQTSKVNDIENTLKNTTDEELADLDQWMKRPQHVGGVVLIARRV